MGGWVSWALLCPQKILTFHATFSRKKKNVTHKDQMLLKETITVNINIFISVTIIIIIITTTSSSTSSDAVVCQVLSDKDIGS